MCITKFHHISRSPLTALYNAYYNPQLGIVSSLNPPLKHYQATDLEETFPHFLINVHGLIVYWIVSGRQGLSVLVRYFVDEVSDLVDVVWVVDVPKCTYFTFLSSYPLQLRSCCYQYLYWVSNSIVVKLLSVSLLGIEFNSGQHFKFHKMRHKLA